MPQHTAAARPLQKHTNHAPLVCSNSYLSHHSPLPLPSLSLLSSPPFLYLSQCVCIFSHKFCLPVSLLISASAEELFCLCLPIVSGQKSLPSPSRNMSISSFLTSPAFGSCHPYLSIYKGRQSPNTAYQQDPGGACGCARLLLVVECLFA